MGLICGQSCPGFSCLGSHLMWSWMSALYRLNARKDEYKHVFSDTYKPFCSRRCWCRRVTLRVINPTPQNNCPHLILFSRLCCSVSQRAKKRRSMKSWQPVTKEESVRAANSSKARSHEVRLNEGNLKDICWGTEAGLKRNEVVKLGQRPSRTTQAATNVQMFAPLFRARSRVKIHI